MIAICKVGIAGGGAMGAGIAQLIARDSTSIEKVIIREIDKERAAKARRTVDAKFDGWLKKGRLTAEQAADKKKLVVVTTDPQELADCDLIIEAVPEKIEVKKKVFAELDGMVKPEAIFASNTSALSITEMAEATNRPDKVMGMHFFNPPTNMQLVEIIAGEQTSEETLSAGEDFARSDLKKFTIRVKECVGFLINRILAAYLNEAGLLLQETTLTCEEIDAQAKEFGWVAGPFMVLDMLGSEIAIDVAKILYDEYGERFRPARIPEILGGLGRYGQKFGAGFYIHDPYKGFEDVKVIIDREFPERKSLSAEKGFERMMMAMVAETIRCLEEGVAGPSDIERGCLTGIGFSQDREGPLHYADSLGIDYVLERLEKLQKKYGARFAPTDLLREMVANDKLGEKTSEGFFDYL